MYDIVRKSLRRGAQPERRQRFLEACRRRRVDDILTSAGACP
jgi:hypothetical protein